MNPRIWRSCSRAALVLACALVLGAASASAQSAADDPRKRAQAGRVPNGAIRVDGRLTEPEWQVIVPITDFVQKEPVEGAPPTDPMEVRFAFDDRALYVGARMSSRDPVAAPLGRRDDEGRAEHLLISLDTFLDRRTASTFGITAAGVRLDWYYASDDEDAEDEGFDPVWEGRVTVDQEGWTAELWIPFSQLRFTDGTTQVWGLNVQRWVPTRNEEVFWSLVPRTERRWASLFGDLHGITGIRPTRRLELLPYAGASSRQRADRDPSDPFGDAGDLAGRLGLDAKVGLGPNLTFEASVNPDFGQVEADPAEVNLTAFETFFDERRPFFIEGAQRLTGPVNNYFYSRRIGAPPAGRADGDYVDRPATTTILGAAKLTGRLRSGTSVGVLGAVTAEEWARTFSLDGGFGRQRVAPRTTFAVGRVEQEFGPPGSTIGAMATMMHRDFAEGDALASLLTRNAFSLSTDALLRLRDGEYEARLFAGGSFIDGTAAAIDRVQRSSARYFHRPDADHLTYDPTRTSMNGLKAGGSIERRTGTHWNWSVDSQIESAGFETNDFGRTSSVDQVDANWRLEYRETVPGSWWRSYEMGVSQNQRWTLDGDRELLQLGADGSITWPNFWETDAEFSYSFRAFDPRLTRGGPMMQIPQNWRAELDVENSNASRTRAELSLQYGGDENGGIVFATSGALALQPGSQWQLSLSPRYERLVDTQQYVTTRRRESPLDTPPVIDPSATFGQRYVFGRIDRSTYSTALRFTYTFQPDLTLDFYGEPFAASGHYDSMGELPAARGLLLRQYGTGGTTAERLEGGGLRVTDGAATFDLPGRDFNVQSFRSNLVLRWEWRPGSTFYVVWQQDRSEQIPIGARASLADMFSAFNTQGDHLFAIKASWWVSGR